MSFSLDEVLDISVLTGKIQWFAGKNNCLKKGTVRIDTKNLSDEAVAVKIKTGQHDLSKELVYRHSQRLYNLLFRMVHSESVAEDLLQDTWVLFMRKLHQYDVSRPFRPWITKIAVNCCRDHWRRRQRRPWRTLTEKDLTDDRTSGRTGASEIELENRSDVMKALSVLSPKLREVVVLKFYSGLTHAEISEILGKPTGTIKSRLHLALTKLREFFDGEGRLK